MASRVQVAPSEYLSMSFDGTDREYVRGEIVERSMPNFLHGEMQFELAFRFRQLRDSHRLFGCSETRMRLAPDLYRIPDIAVFAESKPDEPVPSRPPLVAIEIVSPDDRYSEMLGEAGGIPAVGRTEYLGSRSAAANPCHLRRWSSEDGALARSARLPFRALGRPVFLSSARLLRVLS